MSAPLDLSQFHKTLGHLFPDNPISSEEWSSFRLSPDKVQEFQEQGFITKIPLLRAEQVEILRQEYNQFLSPIKHHNHSLFHEFHANESGDPNNVLMHCLGGWRITPGFHDLVFHPKIVAIASQLLGEIPIRLWHDQLFAKPPRHGGCVSWHQDYSYWTRTTPMNHITVHIALDEQTVDNGCLHYIPKSHHWTRNGGPLPIVDRNFGDMESVKTILSEDELQNFKPVPMLLKPGEAAFHAALTLHGSFPNRSDSCRRAAVVNYFGDGTRSATDEPLLLGVPALSNGTRLEGQFFPLVFDPKWVCK